MKLLNLTLADGQTITINSTQISELCQINNEDLVAKTRIVLNNDQEHCVVESITEINDIINS